MALLKGKTAVITGGSAGIGLATAKRFVEEGAYVFINGRSQAELDAAVKEIGENVTGVQGDGSKQGDRDRLYTAVADTGRRLDIVFANAAAIDVARIGEVTQEHLQKALPLLNDGGSIILNSSTTNANGNDGIGVYAAIVAALRSLAPTWVSELRDRKIRVNVISPDATETPGIKTLAGILNPGPNAAEEFENYQLSIVRLARYATAEEVANAALFLASDPSSFTTGANPAHPGLLAAGYRPPADGHLGRHPGHLHGGRAADLARADPAAHRPRPAHRRDRAAADARPGRGLGVDPPRWETDRASACSVNVRICLNRGRGGGGCQPVQVRPAARSRLATPVPALSPVTAGYPV
jgi:NAD(P)-dependent dehydrogenase (short-subunit alcohol dehydrogenase family)